MRLTATPAALAVAAALALAGPASACAGTAGPSAMPSRPAASSLRLRPMPAGTVIFGRDSMGDLTAHVTVLGLTPGSAHGVDLLLPGRPARVSLSPLTAGRTGGADSTLTSTFAGALPPGGRLRIHLGTGTGIGRETVAQTGPLPAHPTGPYWLTAADVSQGVSWGTPRGSASISYRASSHTLTVVVDASGMTPGPHAAHIHLGSCRNQGPVKYALADLMANKRGVIAHAVRVLPGVTTPIPAHGWYLNIHEGDSATIASNGQPTIFFRSLLCANIVTSPRAR